MLQFIQNLPLIAHIMMGIVAMNVALSGIKAGLDTIKDQTKSDLDNNASTSLGRVCTVLSKVIDIVGMNPKH